MILDAWESLSAKPLRTVAMVAGIVLGVGSATAAVLIADTQQNQIDRRFDLQRSAHVILQGGSSQGIYDPGGMALVRQLEAVSAGGEFSIWHDQMPVTTHPAAAPVSAPVIAADAGGLRASGTALISGAQLEVLDAATDANLVWLGQSLAEQLGVQAGQPQSVTIGGRPYSVAGILRNDAGFQYVNSAALLSRSEAAALPGPSLPRVLLHVRPGSAARIAEWAVQVLNPTGTTPLRDITAPDGEILLEHVASDLRTIGLALGGFVGFVGMIAVANTLMMSVNQRRRELGLRSAIGWSGPRIAALILTESGIAGSAAALVGCALGMGVAGLWCQVQGWQLIVAREMPPLLILFGTIASLLGGLIPALRAAAVSPLDAMRT